MWADNETSLDLLGFEVHGQLLAQLVTDEDLLPVTVGVFGDWGGGKSSVMWMLQDRLSAGQYEDVLCLYFDGWMLEGYDDAKAALMSEILMQLGENKKFGPQVRGKIAGLLKLVNFMRVASLGIKTGSSALVGLGVGSGMIDPQSGSIIVGGAMSVAGSIDHAQGTDSEYVDWQQLMESDESHPGPLDIRAFQDLFSQALEESGVQSLVVLIDNLDRCAPDRLVENLEAIKLFLAVPKTAFVIAADEWIVRYAISSRYDTSTIRNERAGHEIPRDLATDYLEKLIQVPYHLPRLSPSEIESYVTLLFCQLHLDPEVFQAVLSDCVAERQKNFYTTYGAGAVQNVLGGEVPDALALELHWTGGIAPRLAEGLKGNPRQVKRFLNALLLRKRLGEIATLRLQDAVLVKLMLLEYTHFNLFNQLYEWQAQAEGKPRQLAQLEEGLLTEVTEREKDADVLPDGAVQEWLTRSAQAWIRLEPRLGDGTIDLRDYFWVARDRIQSTVSGLSMLSPFVRGIFEQLISENPGEQQLAAAKLSELRPDDLGDLLSLLALQVRQHQDQYTVNGLMIMIEKKIEGSAETLLDALSSPPASTMDPPFAFDVQRVSQLEPSVNDQATTLLNGWAATETAIGRAAKSVLSSK